MEDRLYEIYTDDSGAFTVGSIVVKNNDDIVIKGIDEEGKAGAYYAMPIKTVREMIPDTPYLQKIRRYMPYADKQMKELKDDFFITGGTNFPQMAPKTEWFRKEFPEESAKIRKYLMISGYVIGKLGDTANIGDHGSSQVRAAYTVTPLQGSMRTSS